MLLFTYNNYAQIKYITDSEKEGGGGVIWELMHSNRAHSSEHIHQWPGHWPLIVGYLLCNFIFFAVFGLEYISKLTSLLSAQDI
jgi:hypothetical protein